MHLIRAHKGRVCALAYSPDGKWLASGGEDKKVRVWNSLTCSEQAVLKGHKGCVYALAFTPSGNHLASGGGRNELFLWGLDDGTRTTLAGHTVLVNGVAFSSDGRVLVSTAGNVFDSHFGGEMKVWVGEKWPETFSRSVQGGAWAVAINPADGTIAVGTGAKRVEVRTHVELRNPGTGLPPPFEAEAAVRAIAFSPDGAFLATASGWSVQVWEVRRRALQQTLRGHNNLVWHVSYTRDGKRLVSGSEDGLVKVWDTVSGAELKSYDWGIGKVRAVAVAPDGLTCAAAGDGAVTVWDVEE